MYMYCANFENLRILDLCLKINTSKTAIKMITTAPNTVTTATMMLTRVSLVFTAKSIRLYTRQCNYQWSHNMTVKVWIHVHVYFVS